MLGRVDVYMGGPHSCAVEEGALPLSLPRNIQNGLRPSQNTRKTLGCVGPWGQCLQSERTRQARPSRFVPTLILYFPLSCGLAAWYWNRKDVE